MALLLGLKSVLNDSEMEWMVRISGKKHLARSKK